MGVLYAPATPAAMPHAVRMRTRSGETFHRRASAEANAAPIWMIGPSRPSEPPVAMVAIDEAPRASDGRSRTVRRPSETTSIMCEMPLGPFSPKKKKAINPPTRPPAAGIRTRRSGPSARAPTRMSSAPMSIRVTRCVRNRKAIAPRPPSRPAAAARIRNWVLGSRQKKRPNREGRAGETGSGALILHLRASRGRSRPRRHPGPRRRRRGRRVFRRRCCPPSARRRSRRRAFDRSGRAAGRTGSPGCR